MRLACALALVASMAAGPASAELGPQRASDAVQLLSSQNAACTIYKGGFAFDTRVLPSGERPAFVVPKGKVLMVRRIRFMTFNAASVPLDVSVIAGPPDDAFAYALRSLVTDATGVTNLEFDFPVGFAVAEGSSVCIASSAAPGNVPNARLEGYLTKAR